MPLINPNSGGDYTLIESQLLGSNQATITFAAIPNTFKHLELFIDARTTNASTLQEIIARFNNDTGANYDWQLLQSTGAASQGSQSLTQTSIRVGYCVGSTGVANDVGISRTIIPNYANSSFNKLLQSQITMRSSDATNGMFMQYVGGFWTNTAAISEIDLIPAAGSFETGSLFELYGIG